MATVELTHEVPPVMSAPGPTLLSADREAAVFWRMRFRSVRGVMRGMFARSRLHVVLVFGLSVFFWIGLYWLFRDAFAYLLATFPQIPIIEQIFNMFFLTLMTLLMVSSSILLYSNAFRSREVQFLFTTPARDRRLFLYKFQETIWFCSWGFLLLGTPMLFAYGVAVGAPWYYYVLLPLYTGAFVCIPGCIGAIACLIVIYYLPAVRRHALGLIVGLAIAGGLWTTWSLVNASAQEALTPKWFWELSQRMEFARQSLLPSNWLSSGLMEAARADTGHHADVPWYEALLSATDMPWAEAIRFAAVLIANALFFLTIAYWLAGAIYRAGYHRLQGEFNVRRRTGVAWIDRAIRWCTWFLPGPLRPLIVKDVRLFRRDPLQWTQVLLFFGLLTLYFSNIRRFVFQTELTWWINLIGFLNLAVVGLIMSTFMTRFVFPMISLEGRRFWILARLPIRREAILWSKFLFAAVGAWLPCAGLILLSDLMLPVATVIVWIHQLDCLAMCAGLAGIAVGLGATIPDLREASPSKIAAGFGGTMNLVLSAIFVFSVVIVTAVPCHMSLMNRSPGILPDPPAVVSGAAPKRQPYRYPDREPSYWRATLGTPSGLAAASAIVAVLGSVATVVPLRAGFKAFRRLEA